MDDTRPVFATSVDSIVRDGGRDCRRFCGWLSTVVQHSLLLFAGEFSKGSLVLPHHSLVILLGPAFLVRHHHHYHRLPPPLPHILSPFPTRPSCSVIFISAFVRCVDQWFFVRRYPFFPCGLIRITLIVAVGLSSASIVRHLTHSLCVSDGVVPAIVSIW